MKISDFYSHPVMVEAWGKARIRRVISELREVWPDFLVKQAGQIPSFYRTINEYYAAWLLFILSNAKSYAREDVLKAILRGRELKDKDGRLFIEWFGSVLRRPTFIRDTIRSVYVFYDQDNMVSVFTEVDSHYKGTNLLFHGKSPAFKIRRSAVLEKDFLLEISELLDLPDDKWDFDNPINADEPELSDEEVLREFERELMAARESKDEALITIWKEAIEDHKRGMELSKKKK